MLRTLLSEIHVAVRALAAAAVTTFCGWVVFAQEMAAPAQEYASPAPAAVDSIVATVLAIVVQFATGSEIGAWIVTIVAILMALHPIASAITNMTDTPKDDAWVGWVYKHVLERLALIGGKAKQLPGGVDPSTLVKQ